MRKKKLTQRGNILLVGACMCMNASVRDYLESEYYRTREIPCTENIEKHISSDRPDLIILSLSREFHRDISTIHMVKACETPDFIPVLCLSEQDDLLMKMELFQEGADDVVCTALDHHELLGRVNRLVHMSVLTGLLNVQTHLPGAFFHGLFPPSGKSLYHDSIYAYFKKTLEILTGHKLTLLRTREEMDRVHTVPASLEGHIEKREDIRTVKEMLQAFIRQHALKSPVVKRIEVTSSEAFANVVKYGQKGTVRLGRDNGTVFIRVDDYGKGIGYKELLRSIFIRDFTSQRIHRLGYPIMIDMSDHIYLSTDSTGTSLLLKFAVEMAGKDQILSN